MKLLKYLILSASFITSLFSQGWVVQPSGTPYNLSSVFFVNDLTGWAAGDVGTIRKTTNGGINWFAQTGSSALSSLYFINSTTGWGSGPGGLILKTTNAGDNWLIQTSGTTSHLLSLIHI